ncbi:MAG: metal-dependent transcriptional regulator [Phycisphaeraceae bacterium]|nr:metal-dependent transcriptional regulator [Phycisphaeraceae bacterium]
MHNVSQEDYLKRILLLEQAEPGQSVSMGALAGSLSVAPASVTGMVKTLVRRNWVDYEPYVGVRLTDEGRGQAMRVLRRHRLIELFLVRTLDMDWSLVHKEAEAIEHVVSDDLLERIDAFLGYPTVDPHGDPIPDARLRITSNDSECLADCEAGRRLCVARIIDQDSDFLQYIEKVGLKPGTNLKVVSRDDGGQVMEVRLQRGGSTMLAFTAASRVLVESRD